MILVFWQECKNDLKMALQSTFWRLQQSLQNRVPRVQVLLPLPSKNGLNTAFKPFFWYIFITEHGLNFRCWCSFQASKCSTGANNSNVSVCYIIKIASFYWRTYVYFRYIVYFIINLHNANNTTWGNKI